MAIDLSGRDPWANIGGSLPGAAGAANPALSMIGGDWLQLGMQALGGLFSSSTKVSQAVSASQGALNTSGWAVGEGAAEGGDAAASQTMQNMNSWPWYVWAAGSLVAIAIIKKAA